MPPHSRRTIAAIVATGLFSACLAALTLPAVAEPAEEPAGQVSSRFMLATLPDTQFYSRYAADQFEPRYGSNPYQVQAEWLADHQEDLNIALVAHLGDVVDRAGQQAEWQTADAAHQVLEEGELLYSLLPGNHDLRNAGANDTELDLANEPYLSWFPTSRRAEQSAAAPTGIAYGTDPTGLSEYHVFEAEGQRYLMLALAWRTSDATLAWAEQVMAENPTLPTILASHDILGVASDGVTAVTGGNGERLWQGLIRDNDQIFLTISGHNHGSAWMSRTNAAGNEVIQVLQDWQMHYEGGNGYLGLFEFDLGNDAIHVAAPSPWVTWKPQEALTLYDQPFLEGPNEEFTLEIDFAERFSGFNSEWEPGRSEYPSLQQRARGLILEGFEGVPPVIRDLPGSAEDYVHAAGTLAHWRPGQTGVTEGSVLPYGSVLPDIVDGQDMTRLPSAETGSAGEEGDVVLREGHAFSSDGTGICFENSDRRTNRFSVFAGERGESAINDADLSEGYTVEAFISIGEGWNADANAWTRALARTGNRSRLPGMRPITDYTASPASIGFSNLREFQWTVVGEDPSQGDRQAWSGEITSDDWYHLAIVDDPADGSVRMYIDGMPILRNISGANGMSFEEGFPWSIGAALNGDSWGSGWLGCVGEVRVIDRPTEPSEWLIDRPDLSVFAAEELDLVVTAGQESLTLTGTGQPGATVSSSGGLTGQATVAEDGTWELEAEPSSGPAGPQSFTLTQGFGERTAQVATGTVHRELDFEDGTGFRVQPYLQNPTTDSMLVTWFSWEDESGELQLEDAPVVISAPELQEHMDWTENNRQQAIDNPEWGDWFREGRNYRHQVLIEGLEAGTEYTYAVRQGGDEVTATLTTAPDAESWEHIRLVAMSDTETEPFGRVNHREWVPGAIAEGHQRPSVEDSLWAQRFGTITQQGQEILRYALTEDAGWAYNVEIIDERDPDLMIFPGDLSQGGGYQPAWDEWFRYMSGEVNTLGQRIPVVTALGNWEGFGASDGGYSVEAVHNGRESYRSYFTPFSNGTPAHEGNYHRLDYGPLTVITLDSTKGLPDDHRSNYPVEERLRGQEYDGPGTDTQSSYSTADYEAAGFGDLSPYNEGFEQWDWAREQLADARAQGQIIVVQFHHAPWSSGEHGLPMNHEDSSGQGGTPMRIYDDMFAEHGVAAVLAGHSEMFERSYVDIDGDGRGINYYDVGIAGDGLRGERRFHGNLLSEPYLDYNPYRAWTADRDEPEQWDGEILLDGGKHYGHLEVNIEPSELPGESARMTLTPVYSFPVLSQELEVLGTERRVYDDEVIVALGEDGTVIGDSHSGLPEPSEPPVEEPGDPVPSPEPTDEPSEDPGDPAPAPEPTDGPTSAGSVGGGPGGGELGRTGAETAGLAGLAVVLLLAGTAAVVAARQRVAGARRA